MQELLAAHSGRLLVDGRAGLVRNGHQPEREIQIRIGQFANERAVCHMQSIQVELDSPREGKLSVAKSKAGSKGIFYRQPVPANVVVRWVDVDMRSPAEKIKVLGQVLVPQLGKTRELAMNAALFRGKTVKMELDARGGITTISSDNPSAIPAIQAGVNSLTGLPDIIAAAKKAEEDEAKNEFDAEKHRLQSELDYLKKLDELNTYKASREGTK